MKKKKMIFHQIYCPKCGLFYILKTIKGLCPVCNRKILADYYKKSEKEAVKTLNEDVENWNMRKPALITNKHTAGHRAEIDKLLNAIYMVLLLVGD